MSCPKFIERNLRDIVLVVLFVVFTITSIVLLIAGVSAHDTNCKIAGAILLCVSVGFGVFAIAFTRCRDTPPRVVYV